MPSADRRHAFLLWAMDALIGREGSAEQRDPVEFAHVKIRYEK
jgi:hypothetical protein